MNTMLLLPSSLLGIHTHNTTTPNRGPEHQELGRDNCHFSIMDTLSLAMYYPVYLIGPQTPECGHKASCVGMWGPAAAFCEEMDQAEHRGFFPEPSEPTSPHPTARMSQVQTEADGFWNRVGDSKTKPQQRPGRTHLRRCCLQTVTASCSCPHLQQEHREKMSSGEGPPFSPSFLRSPVRPGLFSRAACLPTHQEHLPLSRRPFPLSSCKTSCSQILWGR